MTSPKPLQRFPTGVPGLDAILDGGLFETGLYVIQGIAGAGKTILANQICFHQAREQRKAVYYTLLTEAHDRMLGFIQTLSFYDASHVPGDVNYVSGFKVLETEGLLGVVRNIREVMARARPSLLVVDGLVSAEDVAPSDTIFKKFLHELQTVSVMFRCTVLLLTNVEAARRLQAEHTMVDGILDLRATVTRLKPQRTIEVPKFRGSGHIRGTHSLEINSRGIEVRPRIEALLRPASPPRKAPAERRPFGIPSLDAVIGGGLPSCTNTMFMGPSGSGKTILGMHFLAAGAAVGERGMFFTFYEQVDELVEKAERLGMTTFVEAVKNGTIQIVWQSSVEANLDKIGNDLLGLFHEAKPVRVFIDGMHGFQVTSDPVERIQDFFAALGDYFVSHGTTVTFTTESGDILGRAIEPPFTNASRMCQNILLLRYTEARGRMRRVFSVVKIRDSGFDPAIREFTITDRGIVIGDSLEDLDKVLIGQPQRVEPKD
ncbi:MAG: hypothetical protein HOV81_26045 [Kofleriaceae bacterium]|nr:hypothetical protein [Kofleriaceae bacterium]